MSESEASPSSAPKRSRSRFFATVEEVNDESENETPTKKSKDDYACAAEKSFTSPTPNLDGTEVLRRPPEQKRRSKRSVSASRVLDESSAQRRLIGRSPRILGSLNGDQAGDSWTRGREINDCMHNFETSNYVSSMFCSCTVCNHSLTTSKVKRFFCKDCKAYVHEGCMERAPMPCIPTNNFPSTPSKSGKKKFCLAEFCPATSPLIPTVLIRCIYALEKYHLDAENIYRASGNEENISRILTRLCSKSPPTMDDELPEDITGSIKAFLKNLRGSLIPKSSLAEFTEGINDDDRLDSAIGDLPATNRDTLAYLCAHLQRVIAHPANGMAVHDLANELNSIIIGTSTEPNSDTDQEDKDEKKEKNILSCLLTLPKEYWNDYLNQRIQFDAASLLNELNTSRPILGRVHSFDLHSTTRLGK